MKPDIRIDSLGIEVPVEHPRRKGEPERGAIHVQVHDNGLMVWDEWCQLCSDGYAFDEQQASWMGNRLSEMPHLDEVHRALLGHQLANRANMVGAHLANSVAAMEAVVAARDGSSVYSADAAGQIKIGWSKKVSARLAQLQTGSAVPIKLLGTMPGGRAVERRTHEMFAHLRLTGEWFTATPELLAYVAEVAR